MEDYFNTSFCYKTHKEFNADYVKQYCSVCSSNESCEHNVKEENQNKINIDKICLQ